MTSYIPAKAIIWKSSYIAYLPVMVFVVEFWICTYVWIHTYVCTYVWLAVTSLGRSAGYDGGLMHAVMLILEYIQTVYTYICMTLYMVMVMVMESYLTWVSL